MSSMGVFAQDDSVLVTAISEAVRNEAATVKVSYASLVSMAKGADGTEGMTVEQASQEAIKNAFQKAIEYATQQFVPQERLDEVKFLVESRIYKHSKNFIVQFKTSSPQISEQEYQVTIEMTISLEDLRKALLENKIFVINYETKFLKLMKLTKPSQVQFVKDILEKDLKNIGQLVETYQKRGELIMLLDTSSSLSEIVSVLEAPQSSADAPHFSVREAEQGTVEIVFQP